jgi:O-antigen/teichoic acid export membrane protein
MSTEPRDAALAPVETRAHAHWAFLRRDAFFGASWTLVGRLTSNGLRIAGNLILTRLLFPEAFGLMALINVFMTGLQLLSDIGINQGVIQSKRGGEKEFLNTAWTLQIVRGLALWVCATAIAWPLSAIYKREELRYLIPVAAITLLLSGFNSTSLFTLNRELKLGKVVGLELSTQAVSLATTIALAMQWKSVWSLIIGMLVGSALKMAGSHVVIANYRNRLLLDRTAARDLIRFGRWIFFSTALGFALAQAEQLVLGRLDTTMSILAFYSIALFLPNAIVDYLTTLSNSVLLPLYSKLSYMGKDFLYKKTLKIRAILFLASCLPLCVLTVVGPDLIDLLYDHRYSGAGPFLRILSAGSIATSIALTGSLAVLLALGDSFRFMLLVLSGTVLKYVAMFVGYKIDSVRGLLIGSSFSVVLNYPFIAMVVRRHGMWQPLFDLGAAAASAAIIGLGVLVKVAFFG